MLPRIKAYLKTYDCQTKWMYFLIEYDGLLEKCNTISKKELDSEPVYTENFLKTK